MDGISNAMPKRQSTSEIMADFAAKGRTHRFVAYKRDQYVSPEVPAHFMAIPLLPSYLTVPVFDARELDYLSIFELAQQLDKIPNKNVHLPFDEMIFICSAADTDNVGLCFVQRDRQERVYFNVISQDDLWLIEPITSCINADGTIGLTENVAEMEPAFRTHMRDGIEAMTILTIALIQFINDMSLLSDQSDTALSARRENERRRKAGEPPMSRPRVLKITEAFTRKVSAASKANKGRGSPKGRHNRRGHFRKKKTAEGVRLIWVRACTIHGGAVKAPIYTLK